MPPTLSAFINLPVCSKPATTSLGFFGAFSRAVSNAPLRSPLEKVCFPAYVSSQKPSTTAFSVSFTLLVFRINSCGASSRLPNRLALGGATPGPDRLDPPISCVRRNLNASLLTDSSKRCTNLLNCVKVSPYSSTAFIDTRGALRHRRFHARRRRARVEGCYRRHVPPRLHLVCGRDGRLHWADIAWGHYESDARRAGVHRRLAAITPPAAHRDCVCTFGFTTLTIRFSQRPSAPQPEVAELGQWKAVQWSQLQNMGMYRKPFA